METNIQVTAKVQMVTPEIAIKWLSDKWVEQRVVRSAHVNSLAADMESGRFKIGPDAILRIKGKVANGQHRLAAVVQTGKAQRFIVMESEDAELYKVIDAGLRRTVSDCLNGVQYKNDLPALARWVNVYEAGAINQSDRNGQYMSTSNCLATRTEVIEYVNENLEALVEAATFIAPLYRETQLLSKSIGGALYFIASTNPEKCELMKAFLSGVYINGGDTDISVFRNRLISNRGSRARLNPGYLFLIAIKAFNFYCDGLKNVKLSYRNGEAFPRI